MTDHDKAIGGIFAEALSSLSPEELMDLTMAPFRDLAADADKEE